MNFPPSRGRPVAGVPMWIVAAVAAVAALAGCAALPPPVVPPPAWPVPAQWADPAPAAAEKGGAAAAAPTLPMDLAQWWRPFGAPELDALVERALGGNASLAAARARLLAARTLQGRGGTAYRPQLSLAGAPASTPESRKGYFQFGFDARWELPLWGRDQADADRVAADTALAQAQVDAVRAMLVAEVARTWFEARHADRLGQLARDEAASAVEGERLQRSRVDAGLAPAASMIEARAERLQAEQASIAARAAAVLPRQRLRVLLGLIDEAAPVLSPTGDDTSTSLPATPLPPLPADLLRLRPDVRQAEQRVLQAAAEAGLAQADLRARVSLGGMLGLVVPVIGPGAGSRVRSAIAVGPTIDIPLFDWGRRQDVLAARRLSYDAELADYRQVVVEALADAQGAIDQLALQRERLAGTVAGEEVARSQRDAARTRARLGLGDAAASLAPQRAVLQARRERATAELDVALAYVSLAKSLGGGALPAPGQGAAPSPGGAAP